MKIYTDYKQIKFSSEQLILLGCIDNVNDERRMSVYEEVKSYCMKHIDYVSSPSCCDVIVLPHKFRGVYDNIYLQMVHIAKHFDKPLLCFYNDDDDSQHNIDNCVRLYRTSINMSTKLSNEFALPPLCTVERNESYTNELTIGFCGSVAQSIRRHYLNALIKSDITTNVIIRRGFGAPGIDKKVAIQDFFQNIQQNTFTFCCRGAGNFSYRFYEVMGMGRIPILIMTDNVIPFWEELKSRKLNTGIVLVNDGDDIVRIVKEYYTSNKDNIIEIQKMNKYVFQTYFSGLGFIKRIIEH